MGGAAERGSCCEMIIYIAHNGRKVEIPVQASTRCACAQCVAYFVACEAVQLACGSHTLPQVGGTIQLMPLRHLLLMRAGLVALVV